ncbi:hypothetical protein Heshes_10830 [Alicyclobacillus hesperidum]|uniref:Photosynthesis system II assembly factor Ycf48/Hcf136-like domain-containing protein n=1 Tax=Alicyclobacillus hesperidum TaxID=89784 RepID=A0AA37U6C4_9BACL|nr:hypothetical protein [Alicyclobacillus hesperidum]GLV13399.1 hypothetical protein Heshes_10830 [Alicyclobacillus hesperidum]
MKPTRVRLWLISRRDPVQRLGIVVILLGAIVAVGTDMHANFAKKGPSLPDELAKAVTPGKKAPRTQGSALPGLHVSPSIPTSVRTATSSEAFTATALLPWTNGQWAVSGNTWYREDDDFTWRNVTPPTVVSSDAIVTACGFDSQNIGVIATLQNGVTTIYSTNDGGNTWVAANLPAAGEVVRQVDMVNAHVGYAYAEDGSLFSLWETVNGGQNWVTTLSGTNPLATVNPWFPSTPQAISFSSAAVGYRWSSPTSIAYTTNAGSSWSSELPQLSLPNGTAALTNIHWTELPQFFGNVGIWALEASIANKRVYIIYRSSDGGVSWSPVAVERWTPGVALHFVTPQTGWAIDPKQNKVFTTDNGGDTWKSVASSIRVSSLIDVQPISTSQAYAIEILKSGSIRWMVTTDGGESWSATTYPFPIHGTP